MVKLWPIPNRHRLASLRREVALVCLDLFLLIEPRPLEVDVQTPAWARVTSPYRVPQ